MGRVSVSIMKRLLLLSGRDGKEEVGGETKGVGGPIGHLGRKVDFYCVNEHAVSLQTSRVRPSARMAEADGNDDMIAVKPVWG